MRNAIQIDKNEVQKFQTTLSRVDTNKRDAHDDRHEQALLIAYKNGDDDSGWELFKGYSEVLATIYRYPTRAPRNTDAQKKLEYDTLTPYEKDDLFQEIALQFFKLAKEYEPEKPFEHAVRAILHQRVFNQFFSRELDIKFNEQELPEEETTAEDNDLEVADTPAKHLDLYNALNQLSAIQREAVTMSVVKGWNATIIAQEMGIEKATAQRNVQRGLKKLREIMIPKEESYNG